MVMIICHQAILLMKMINMTWEKILKNKRDYTYGRCQVNEGIGCIRPLQSPKARERAGSKPDGKICMYCEDDSYKWSHVPKEVWSNKKWKEASDSVKRKILDTYVKWNKKYDHNKFEPFYD